MISVNVLFHYVFCFRNRVEEKDEDSISKRIKAEPVTPSKSPNNQSNLLKSEDNKSSEAYQKDEVINLDSDEEIDYTKIDTDVASKQTELKTVLRHKRQTSPVPDINKQKKVQKNESRSSFKSPSPKKRSPNQNTQNVAIKSEPVSPSPKESSMSDRKSRMSRNDKIQHEVKFEREIQSQTVRKQEMVDEEYIHSEREQDVSNVFLNINIHMLILVI